MHFQIFQTAFNLQECGRAGRDGEAAQATLYFNGTDIRSNRPGISRNLINFCKNNDSCLRDSMLSYFGYKANEERDRSMCCSVCNHSLLEGAIADLPECELEEEKATVLQVSSGDLSSGTEEQVVIVDADVSLAELNLL